MSHRETPYKRTLPSGREVWVARYTGPDGKRRYAKPSWNRGRSTFALKREAQHAIDEAYDLPARRDTIGGYAESWTRRRPRGESTNATNDQRIAAVLDVELEGRRLGDWCFDELRRRQVNDLVDHMLRTQGRAVTGARGILGTFSAMCEDAIDDEAAADNPFKGLRLRRNDPRVQKPSRPIRIWSFEEMRAFAAAGRPDVRAATKRPIDRRRKRPGPARFFSAHDYEAMILTPGLTGLRLGEVLAVERARFDGESFELQGTANDGVITGSTETKNHHRSVPVPPSLAVLINRRPPRIDTQLLYPTPHGQLWRRRNFYRDVWDAARIATGMNPTPHEFRHSFVSNLRAAGIDDADLADVAGHDVETMLSTYTHPLRASHDRIREVIG
jgi:integrase